MSKPRVIYWFRTDLRLHDSPALKAALDLNPEAFYPIWCWDSHYVYRARVGVNRWQFLIDCQNDVSQSITKLNPKSKLFVLREPAVTLLPKLFKKWNITHLVFEKDTDAYAKARDQQVLESAKSAGVQVIIKSGRTLWDSDEIVKANRGQPTMSLTQLQNAGNRLGDIAKPVETPTSWPDPGDMDVDFEHQLPHPHPDFNEEGRNGIDWSFQSGIAGPNGDFSAPTLDELGFPPATTPYKGGESVIMRQLEELLADEEFIGKFEKPKTSPAAFSPQSTCLTSPYLHFGALSCRYFYHKVEEILVRRRKQRKTVSTPPTSLHGQLLFRDMYFGAQAAIGPAFSQTYNNGHCRFIPWHLPSKVDPETRLVTGGYEVDDEEKEQWLHRWTHGMTGFPWIDAIMRQLRLEGWCHHLARHSVACFLTRGGCYISWERGAEVFEELLLDHEVSCNAGNWQWLSCTAFFSQFYRCYSPVAFGKKWDEDGEFIRKYVPELRNFPKKFIYEPHKAPIADQRKAGVRITGNGSQTTQDGVPIYPKPMFDFSERRDICMQGMKDAYKAGMYGNDPKVLDGTWPSAFSDNSEGPTAGNEAGPGGLSSWQEADGSEEVFAEIGLPQNMSKPHGKKRQASQSTLDGSLMKKPGKK
ncbi:Hypothetical protein R9X50_00138400 [Acrodontium crateriforme]|uniref:Photolyase/cryptochrome alpha/beta domain-containing protein n=1 Tax=Acrodontium crateriforme TaxID=150365 RepID=A0AAQ3M522_9PEZI|nr:Hypothetical protein R9X50_00138400 [Acrodontium crateriforme]